MLRLVPRLKTNCIIWLFLSFLSYGQNLRFTLSYTTSKLAIYVPGTHQELAKKTYPLVKKKIDYYSSFFDLDLNTPIRVFLFPSPSHFFSQPLDRQRLFSVNDPYSVSIFFPGSWEAYEKLIGTALAYLYIYHAYREVEFLQRTSYEDVPFWFKEGLALYLGEGWTIQDELLLLRYSSDVKIKKLKDITPFTEENYLLAKSVWHYIVTQYRWHKAKEIFVLGKLSGSAATGLYSSLGISISEFTQQWVNFLNNEYQKKKSFQNLPSYKSYLIPFPNVLGFSVNPDQKTTAILTFQRQRFELYLISFPFRKQEKIKPSFAYRFPIHSYFQRYLVVNLLWKDENHLLVTLPTRDAYSTIVFDVDNGKIVSSREIQWRRFDLIQDLFYSSQLKAYLFCGVDNGSMNLYSLDDQFRKLQPFWKQSKFEEIRFPVYANAYFWSETDIDSLTQLRYKTLFRTFSLHDTITQFSHLSPTEDLLGIYPLDPYRLILFQNITGRPNLFLQDTHSIKQITRFDLPLFQAQFYSLKAYVLTYFGHHYYLITFQLDTTVSYFQEHTPFQERILRTYLTLKSKKLREKELLQTERQQGKKQERRRFFFFDDTPPGKIQENNSTEVLKTSTEDKPRWERTINGLEKRSTRDLLFIDPLYRIGIGMEWQFQTPSQRTTLLLSYSTFLDLRSNSFALDIKHRLNNKIHVGTTLERHVRLWRAPDYLQFNWYGIHLYSRYLLSSHQALAFEFLPSYFSRKDLKIYDGHRYDSTQLGYLARLQWHWDKVRYHFQAPYQGFAITFQCERYQGLTVARSFWRLQLHARWYLSPFQGITWATQFQGGAIFGNYTPLYRLGGVNQWFNYQVAERSSLPLYDAPESIYLFQLTMPVRGYPYNYRRGTKYAILNTEIRFAFGEMFLGGLPYRNHMKLHWLLFGDIGTAWTTGNPFSQRNPIHIQTFESYPVTVTIRSLRYPFLISAGTGLSFNLAGVTMVPTLAFLFEDATFTTMNFLLHFEKPF